jgi:hypothetical protein
MSLDLSVLDKIDWEALSKIYKIKNWRWQIKRNKPHVPTAAEIQEVVFDLVSGMDDFSKPKSQCGTGRITVYRLDDVIRVWVGNNFMNGRGEPGFWAHKAQEELLELDKPAARLFEPKD